MESMGRVSLEVLGAGWFGELKDVIRYGVSTYFERQEVDGTRNQATQTRRHGSLKRQVRG